MEDVIETLLGNEIVDEQDVVRDMQELAREKWNRRLKLNRKLGRAPEMKPIDTETHTDL